MPYRAWSSDPGSAGVPVDASRIASPASPAAGYSPHVGHETDAPDDGCRMDRAAVGVVVERDVARDDRQTESLARLRHPLDHLRELPPDLRLLRVAEVEAIGEPEWLSPCTGDVPGRFEDRRCATGERVERAEATGSVERDREPSIGGPQPQHRGVEAGPANGSRLDELVVAARHERARAEGVGAEQVEEHVGRRRDIPERHLGRRLSRHPLHGVARAVVGEEAGGYRAGDVAFPQGAQLAGLGHLADDGAMQLPAVDHGLHLGEAVGRDDRHHSLLRLGDHDLPRLHPVLALRDVVEMDVDPVVGGHLRERRGEPRGATVLERQHEPTLDELDGHLDQALAREGVTDLDGRPLVGRLVAELLTREHRGTSDAVPAGGGAEEDERARPPCRPGRSSPSRPGEDRRTSH